MEEIEEISISNDFSLAELTEVEFPVLRVIEMDEQQPCCSKSVSKPLPTLCCYSSSDDDDKESVQKKEGGSKQDLTLCGDKDVDSSDDSDFKSTLEGHGSKLKEGTEIESDDDDDTNLDAEDGSSEKEKTVKKKVDKEKRKDHGEKDKNNKTKAVDKTETEKKNETGQAKSEKGKRKSDPEKKRTHKKKKLDKQGSGKKSDKVDQEAKKDSDDEAAGSSDEDVNELNKVANQVSEFKSIKDLPEKCLYKVLQFEIVETVNGRTVRVQLEDPEVDEGFFYVHLPKRFLSAVEANFKKYKAIVASKKPFYFSYLGQKGRSFKVIFTRNPEKFQSH